MSPQPSNDELRKQAEDALKDVESRRDEVKEVSEKMIYLKKRNHFGELMLSAMMSKGKPA